jgi:hypothetical protein
MGVNMEENIFKKACLVQISTPVWQGSLQLPPEAMERLGDSAWLKGRKHLIDPETLAPVRSMAKRARAKIEKYTLSFPINGLILVPKDRITDVEDSLRESEVEFWEAVEKFVDQYFEARYQAELNLGEYYNDADYPVEIRAKFGFVWRFLALDTPGKGSILTPEMYERERERFLEMMEETRQNAVLLLRAEYAKFVGHLIERLEPDADGSKKMMKSSSLERFQEFLDLFKDRNLFEDNELEALVAKTRGLVNGVDVEMLKSSDEFGAFVKKGMERVAQEVTETFLTVAPRRRIVLPKVA